VPDINPTDILTPEELAKRLKVPLGWVREKVRARKQGTAPRLPHFKAGKYIRFHWPAVSAWLFDTQRGGTAAQTKRRQ
jgi:excisionase family DNA binding protein